MNRSRQLVQDIQAALRESKIPAWLFYGFQDVDPLARRVLQFDPGHMATRRWFYLVPAQGEPRKLVHRIEWAVLDHLPGSKHIYLQWQNLQSELKKMLNGFSPVAMQYSEENAIPYISRVDAGTVGLVRSCGAEVVSSADLLQRFEAVLNFSQLDQHRRTARMLTAIVESAFQWAASRITAAKPPTEAAIQEFILNRFQQKGLITDHPPIIALNANSADPHYETGAKEARAGRGDFLLIDLWAKPAEDGIYADLTWTAYMGERAPRKVLQVFEAVRQARDAGVDFLRSRLKKGKAVQGWEVDDAVRRVIDEAGFGQYFVHRTGHNLGRSVHGNGVHFDNLETHDTRAVLPGLVCTIEPGIYLPGEFGVRSEINVTIGEDDVEVTAPRQEHLWLADQLTTDRLTD